MSLYFLFPTIADPILSNPFRLGERKPPFPFMYQTFASGIPCSLRYLLLFSDQVSHASSHSTQLQYSGFEKHERPVCFKSLHALFPTPADPILLNPFLLGERKPPFPFMYETSSRSPPHFRPPPPPPPPPRPPTSGPHQLPFRIQGEEEMPPPACLELCQLFPPASQPASRPLPLAPLLNSALLSSTHRMPEQEVHTKLPTVMSV